MSEQVFYHGTRRGFTRGGYLMPRSFHHGEGTTAPLKPGRTLRADAQGFIFMTTRVDIAWVYAWHAQGRGKPKVLTVEPDGWIESDPEHSADMEAYRCNGLARVLQVDTEPIVSEAEARGGWVS